MAELANNQVKPRIFYLRCLREVLHLLRQTAVMGMQQMSSHRLGGCADGVGAQGAGPVHQREGDSLSAPRGSMRARLAGEQLGVSLGMQLPKRMSCLGKQKAS